MLDDVAEVSVRAATPTDVPRLLELMRELAAFERYLPEFAVTPADLLERGFPPNGNPQFSALLVGPNGGVAVGYAAYYLVPFTFDLRPTLVLKELFVAAPHRRTGAGTLLFDAVARDARSRGCGKVQWAVLPDNERAKAFYCKAGGEPESNWELWTLRVDLPFA